MKNLIVAFIISCSAHICFCQPTIKPTSALMNIDEIKLFYLDGKACKIFDFKGKFILIDIWGQECKPCVKAIPELNELQKKYKNRLIILSINDRIHLDRLPQFLKEHSVGYTIAIPKTDEDLMPIYYTFSAGKFTGFPFYALLDEVGNVLKRDTHYTEIESFLKP